MACGGSVQYNSSADTCVWRDRKRLVPVCYTRDASVALAGAPLVRVASDASVDGVLCMLPVVWLRLLVRRDRLFESNNVAQ